VVLSLLLYIIVTISNAAYSLELNLIWFQTEPLGIAQGRIPGVGVYPLKYAGGVQSMFWLPLKNVTFFHSKLLLDNSATFTSSRMKDWSQNGRYNEFFEAPETVWWLELTDLDPHFCDRFTPLGLSKDFNRPDALPVAQPTVSDHCLIAYFLGQIRVIFVGKLRYLSPRVNGIHCWLLNNFSMNDILFLCIFFLFFLLLWFVLIVYFTVCCHLAY